MSKIIITADSTCDLSPEQREQYGILISPLYVRLGEEEYKDGVDIDAKKLFDYVAAGGALPKTAACSMDDYIALWKPYIDEGYEVVHINISSEFSSCHQNARLAAEELGHAYPVDSRSLSTGTGLLALEAADLAKEGKSGEEIKAILDEKQKKLNVSFVLDTMEYLAKGGRCSSMAALAAGLIKLRLGIDVKDGKMGVGKKYRGKMAPVLKQYVQERLASVGDVELKRIFITHTGVDDETVAALAELIRSLRPFSEVLTSHAGCTVCSHCGPGTLGILFFEA